MRKQKLGLLNSEYMENTILKNARWSFTHGAGRNYLGFGALYYSLIYAMRAKIAVCLGSGGGFVPRIIRQAQRDIGIAKGSRTILIDANKPEGGFGAPDFLPRDSFFRTRFPDVELVVRDTKDAAGTFKLEKIKIDFLYIDADHTFEETLSNYEIYRSFMAERFVIIIHDTRFTPGVIKAVERIRLKNDIGVIDFNYISYGIALITPR